MKILGIIPARFASTRFPGKPLTIINGKTMIQRVYEQSLKAESLTDVVVATDDQRIYDAVIAFGGNVMLTSSEHNSGTDRCCEIVEKIGNQYDAAVNIQGDEPFINPEQINQIASLISTEKSQIASLCKPIKDEDELFDENVNQKKKSSQVHYVDSNGNGYGEVPLVSPKIFMAENPIQGFQTNTGVEKYYYNALAKKPILITQTEVNKAVAAANKYTDEQIAKINTNPTVQIELDTTLSEEGKAADAKAVGDALGEKLDKNDKE